MRVPKSSLAGLSPKSEGPKAEGSPKVEIRRPMLQAKALWNYLIFAQSWSSALRRLTQIGLRFFIKIPENQACALRRNRYSA
jgi:hypothetical protein